MIAILAAILLPALQNARDMAKRANCLSNKRQLRVTAQLFGSDYNEIRAAAPSNAVLPGRRGNPYNAHTAGRETRVTVRWFGGPDTVDGQTECVDSDELDAPTRSGQHQVPVPHSFFEDGNQVNDIPVTGM